ncbi:MAG: PD-(D/E)XK nuclease family protein [Bacilli bacterium]|nr:PD-(D/E)XK nuclease family protein [Bacilli bacterium]
MIKTLFITDNKNKYLKKNELINIKYITFNELLKELYFTYDEKTIYYLVNKYNMNVDIARIYLNNLIYLNEYYTDDKIDFLFNIKNELEKNNLLIKNKLFINSLKQYKIVLDNREYSRFEMNIINKLKEITDIEYYENNTNVYSNSIYKCKTSEEEVIFCINKIVSLIKDGISINDIYISNLNSSYRNLFKKYSYIFNLPINLNDNVSIYSTKIVQTFIKEYESNIVNTLNKIKEIINDKDTEKIYNHIVNIYNKYVWCKDYLLVKDLVIDELKNSKKESIKYTNAINEIDISEIVDVNKYVFLLGFNQNELPKIKKDEDYFNDYEKEKLGLFTSEEIKKNNINKYSRLIKSIKNLYITYKEYDDRGEVYISNINDILNYEIIDVDNNNYNNSNLYNNIELAKMYDEYYKYGTINTNMSVLANNYKNNQYLKYDNNYTNIDNSMLKEYLNNRLTLSYSSLDNYNRCNFRYYLNNVLHLNYFEETFMIFIGNVYHDILQKSFNDDFDFDTCWNNAILNRELTNKENFFLKKLKEELKFVIKTIKEQDIYTSYKSSLYEEKIDVLYGNNTFTGIIDKIKYDGDSLAIIDYKTGNPDINLYNSKYGIGMQLPIYLYLVKHHPKFKDYHIAGFYLQKILNNDGLLDSNEVIDTKKKNNLKLYGYSNSDIEVLKKLDSNYNDSKIIKGLKQSSKGFYQYSKVIDDLTINKLTKLIEDNVIDSFNKILNGKFDINPKKIGINNEGCKYCKFKDICFMKEKDLVLLKEYKNLDFLGGDEYANLD